MTAVAPTPHARRSRVVTIVIGIVVLVLLALGVRWLTQPAAEKPKAAPQGVPVTTARVQQRDVPVYRIGIGTVTATASVTVRARVDGQLDKVGFVEGQDVKAGQMLAQLDPRVYRAQVAQAEAQKARDMATLGNARADLKRYTGLIEEDAATRQQVDTQKALVAQLEATVQTDDALVQVAKVQLSFTTITAPISGRVGARLVDAGNIVRAADTSGLVVINQVDPITAVFTLPEEAVPDIHRAQAAHESLTVEALPREGTTVLARGTLVLLNNQIDTTSGTVQLKASFPNASRVLWPGQFVNVRLKLGQRAGAMTIPESAIQRSQDGTFVYVVDPAGKARAQPVKVVQSDAGVAVVESGLAANDRVVVAGQYKVKPGVSVVESSAASAPAKGKKGDGASAAGGASAPAGGASAASAAASGAAA